jgi:hypothetical protein
VPSTAFLLGPNTLPSGECTFVLLSPCFALINLLLPRPPLSPSLNYFSDETRNFLAARPGDLDPMTMCLLQNWLWKSRAVREAFETKVSIRPDNNCTFLQPKKVLFLNQEFPCLPGAEDMVWVLEVGTKQKTATCKQKKRWNYQRWQNIEWVPGMLCTVGQMGSGIFPTSGTTMETWAGLGRKYSILAEDTGHQ